MANVNLRSGPLGATAQASKLSHRIVQMVPAYGAIASAYTETLSNSIDQSRSNLFVKATGNGFALTLPSYTKDLFGGDWVVEKFLAIVHTNLASNPLNFDLGVYAFDGNATFTAVDADGIVDGYQIAVGATTGNTGIIQDIPLNGTGGAAESYTTDAGNVVSMKIGRNVGQFTAGDASVAGQDQFLVVTNTDAAGSSGAVQVAFYAVLKPVGGSDFNK